MASDGRAIVLRGDARNLPLPDASVDLIVTSPPYFALRSYTDGGEHYDGQIGSEATPAQWVANLLDCTREWMRVLKPTGSIFVNLGDKYAGGGMGGHSAGLVGTRPQGEGNSYRRTKVAMPSKSLIGLPWRYALACVDDLGLILRAEIIWCLSGGARVYARTKAGDRPIMLRDLARAYRPEDVQLWNGHRWTQVLGWNRTPDDDGALEIELRTGERIGSTPGHRWPTQRGVIRADEIQVGDVIQTTRLPQPSPPRFPYDLPDEDIGWFIGLYIAEGSRSESTIQFAGHVREDARHARLARIAEAYDGTSAVYPTSANGVTCNLTGSVLVGIIDRYVSPGTAKTKRLRSAAWQRSDDFLAAVIEGYLSGDGHFDAKNDRWRLGFTANDEWAADLRTLAARLSAVLRLRRATHSMSGKSFPGWQGEWRWTRSTHHNAKPDGEVVAIRASRARDFYDLGVADEPHLFALASGVLTHNSKPNGLPESVTDRVRRSHEQVFHFTKQPRYFTAVDEIREAQKFLDHPQLGHRHVGTKWTGDRGHATSTRDFAERALNPLGKLPGSVWDIASQPLTVPAELGVDHFAAFPMELPRRIILGWSPSGVCVECGEGRRPVTTPTGERGREPGGLSRADKRTYANLSSAALIVREVTGYACTCPEPTAPTTPAVILDPFGGTGTTALVASVNGRVGISVDRSADYCRLAAWRTTDAKQIERAARPPKPRKPAPEIEPEPEPATDDATDSVIDNPLTTEIRSGAMTTTSDDVKQIQDRQASARGRVIAASGVDDKTARAVLDELAKVFREEADWWEARKSRGWKSTAEQLRMCASRVAGFAVGLTDRAVEPPTDQLTEAETAARVACLHPLPARSKLSSGDEYCVECGQKIDPIFEAPQPDTADVMNYLTGATNVYEPSQPATLAAMVDSPFTAAAPVGGHKPPVKRLAWEDLPRLAAELAAIPRGNVSHSFVTDMESCSLRVMLDRASRHNLIGARRPSWSAVGGTAFHDAVNALERSGVTDLGGLDSDQIWSAHFEVAVRNVIEAQPAVSPYADTKFWYASQGGKEAFDWWRVEGAEMLRRYVKGRLAEPRGDADLLINPHSAPGNYQPVLEFGYQTMIGGVVAQGYIDAAFVLPDASLLVVDFKTGRNAPESTFQLGEYAHVLRSMSTPAATVKGSYWLARSGTYTPPVDVLVAHPLPELEYRYRQALLSSQMGIAAPNVTPMNCVGCPFRDYCPTQG